MFARAFIFFRKGLRMQVQNPDYKFYKTMAGKWKSTDGACTAELTAVGNIEIAYAGARLSCRFSFIQTGPVGIGFFSNNAMGFMGMGMAGMMNEVHEGEELKLRMNQLTLTSGDEELWHVDVAWYGRQQIHLELAGIRDGQKKKFTLTRENASVTPKNKVSWTLQGTSAESDVLTFTCECGYHGPARKFCPECGKATKIYTCDCGCVSIGAKFCPNCGKSTGKLTEKSIENSTENSTEKKVYEKKELLIAISMSMSTNPPRSDGAQVYACSDTEVVLEHGGDQRLISADVIESAYEIIRKNKLDDPEFKDPLGGAIMGGNANIGFKNGDQWVNASMYEKGNAALNAYYELMGLFNKA